MQRRLYLGNNLEILRSLDSQSIDLCATDPPFNSGRDYEGADASFTDKWSWDDDAQRELDAIHEQSYNYEICMETRHNYIDLHEFVSFHLFTEEMRSYLTFMGPRIVEIRGVLKDTGSFYLHCDPSASHYLKTLCDIVFGKECFRNEIVWCYPPGGRGPKSGFHRKHDIILLYGKHKKDGVFNRPYTEPLESTVKSFSKIDENGRMYKEYPGGRSYLDESPGRAVPSWWIDIPSLGQTTNSKERLGYPTQKPVALYERIIKASSNPGDVVLDPFCGCGTTIDAAEGLGRDWIGIDISSVAIEMTKERLRTRHMLNLG